MVFKTTAIGHSATHPIGLKYKTSTPPSAFKRKILDAKQQSAGIFNALLDLHQEGHRLLAVD